MEEIRKAQNEYVREYDDDDETLPAGVSDEGNTYTLSLNSRYKPEIDQIILKDTANKQRMLKVRVRDIYETDYYVNQTAGLVGPPLEIVYEDESEPLELTFHYVEKELGVIPPRNLMVMKYDKNDQMPRVIEGEELDTDNCTLTVQIDGSGSYLLIDRYIWYTLWGEDASEYEYDINSTEIISPWERECNTGDIMEIADKEWALEVAPRFVCSTPEQLAGAVYYVNVVARGMVDVEIILEDDIDLDGYEWAPMGGNGINDYSFYGIVDGQGHKISNMYIGVGNHHSAFIGHSSFAIVKDITFENATVEGGDYTGIVGGEVYTRTPWENVKVQGTINGGYGDEVGSIVGRDNGIPFIDCEADVEYVLKDGSKKHLDYFSHRLEEEELCATEDFTLTADGTVIERNRLENEDSYHKLMWHIEVNGVEQQTMLADTISYDFADYVGKNTNSCKVWLVAHNGDYYVRVSNIIELK